MIFDRLERAGLYRGLSPRFAVAFDFLRHGDLENLEVGRLEIDGEAVFAIVVDELTRDKPECKWESHRRYHDIQYVVHGQEMMGFAPIEQMTLTEPFKPGEDYAFYRGEGQYLTVSAGSFALFAPHDVHRPSIAIEMPQQVRKVVVKVEV